MTLTYPVLNRARAILFIVTGEDKADALLRLSRHDPTIPAGRVENANVLVIADRGAAARLDAGAQGQSMKVLVIDIGGSHVKIMATGHHKERKAESGPAMSARDMVDIVLDLAGHWKFKAVSMGYPGPVVHGKPVLEPKHLAPGWVGFDFERAFGRPVKW